MATPIGNRADITLRALHVLGRVDRVACEDTRVTAQLLAHYGIERPLLALHAHNEARATLRVQACLEAGEALAYVSDAGTPGVSDPGARLVAAVRAAGHRVVPIPGPSAALAALMVSGDTGGQGFGFRGFVPARGGERQAWLQAVTADPGTQLLFEAPHRVGLLAEQLAALAPRRRLTLARELTKQFETVVEMDAAELPVWLAEDPNRLRGEFVVVVHAQDLQPRDASALPDQAERCLEALLRELPLKQAVSLAAEISGAPRKALYQRALQRRAESA